MFWLRNLLWHLCEIIALFGYGISVSFVCCSDNSLGWTFPLDRKGGYEPRVSRSYHLGAWGTTTDIDSWFPWE